VINSAMLRSRLREFQGDEMDPVVGEYICRFGRPKTSSQGSLTLTSPERSRVASSPGRFKLQPAHGFVDTDPNRTVTAKSFEATYRQFPEPEFPEPEAPDFPWRMEEVEKKRKRIGAQEAQIERPEIRERRKHMNSDEYIKYVKKKMKAEHFDRFLEEIYMSAGVTTHRSCPDIMEKGSARESEELGHLLSHYNESVWRQYLKNNAPRDPRTDEPVSYDPAMVIHSSVPPGAVRVNDPLQKKHHEDILRCHKELTTSVRKMESVTKHRVLDVQAEDGGPKNFVKQMTNKA